MTNNEVELGGVCHFLRRLTWYIFLVLRLPGVYLIVNWSDLFGDAIGPSLLLSGSFLPDFSGTLHSFRSDWQPP